MRHRPRALATALLLITAACGRCGKPAGPSDGGAPDARIAGADLPRKRLPAMDVRSGLLLVLPEFRGIYGVRGAAWVEHRYRTERPLAEIQDEVRKALEAEQFVVVPVPGSTDADGGTDAEVRIDAGVLADAGTVSNPPSERLTLQRNRQRIVVMPAPGGVVLTSGFQIGDADIQPLFNAISPVGSETLSALLPRLTGVTKEDSTFHLFLTYLTKAKETGQLLLERQVENLQNSGWTAKVPLDGGDSHDAGTTAQALLSRDGAYGTLELKRSGNAVSVDYVEPLSFRP